MLFIPEDEDESNPNYTDRQYTKISAKAEAYQFKADTLEELLTQCGYEGEALDTAQPVVEYLPGWHCDITAARKWEDLPKEARDYVEYLEKAVGCKITYISVGAEREAYVHHV